MGDGGDLTNVEYLEFTFPPPLQPPSPSDAAMPCEKLLGLSTAGRRMQAAGCACVYSKTLEAPTRG